MNVRPYGRRAVRMAARFAVVTLLCTGPFDYLVARGTPPQPPSPRQALHDACEREAREQHIKGFWARHNFIGKCVDAREHQKPQ